MSLRLLKNSYLDNEEDFIRRKKYYSFSIKNKVISQKYKKYFINY